MSEIRTYVLYKREQKSIRRQAALRSRTGRAAVPPVKGAAGPKGVWGTACSYHLTSISGRLGLVETENPKRLENKHF
ncbi:endonuclease [Lawsonibacter asaccharolyticus]|nr:endonuclease [Lawsonibacter asaccharolyticus]